VLIGRLLDSRPTLFQTTEGKVHLIADIVEDVTGMSLFPSDEVMALLDADSHRYTPDKVLLSPEKFAVSASSLKEQTARKWIDQLYWGCLNHGSLVLQELIITGLVFLWHIVQLSYYRFFGVFLHDRDVTLARLKESVIYLGVSPSLYIYKLLSRKTPQ